MPTHVVGHARGTAPAPVLLAVLTIADSIVRVTVQPPAHLNVRAAAQTHARVVSKHVMMAARLLAQAVTVCVWTTAKAPVSTLAITVAGRNASEPARAVVREFRS